MMLTFAIIAASSTPAFADDKKTYGFLRRHPAGVGAQVTYEEPDLVAPRPNAVSSPIKPSGTLKATGVAAPLALSAHNCIPRTDARGVSLAYTFVESGVADCVSFVSPPPPEPGNPARPHRRPRRPSPEALAQSAYDRVIELASQPDLGVAPARIGLTGLKSFFWIDNDMAPVSATAGVRGLTVTAQAQPTEYTWDFDDGSTRTTRHQGRPWTRTRNGNVGHLYETKGRYEPAVTVVWAARWRVNRGPWDDLGYFSTAGSAEYPVRGMISVLVRRS